MNTEQVWGGGGGGGGGGVGGIIFVRKYLDLSKSAVRKKNAFNFIFVWPPVPPWWPGSSSGWALMNCNVHRTLSHYTAHCTLYAAVHTAHSMLHTAHSILHHAHSILHTLYCTLYTAHSTLYTAYYALYTAAYHTI